MLKQYEASGIHNVVTSAFLESIRGREQEFEGVNILEWIRKEILSNHIDIMFLVMWSSH